jgi:peptidoglycan hydrolase-like protein with peptidoglycan-binding domain
MALNRVWIPSPNYSSRGGASVRLLVLHTAEGARTIESLGSFFQNPSAEVSSHAGADDKHNTIGTFVKPEHKAWTCAEFNPVAVQIETCAFAAWSTAEWDKHPNMLDNVAKWIKEEAKKYGIPIVRLSASQAQGSGRGVCQHSDLGARGGGHHDCGPGFPMDRVLKMAGGSGGGGSTAPAPPAGKAPPFPGTNLVNFTSGHGTRDWQAQMDHRGWHIAVDDLYGGESEKVCSQFQGEKGLAVDGIVGPETWNASWTAPIT